jgi:hypothetical protein
MENKSGVKTYILYDEDLGVYKIGKSGQVDRRLRKLCINNVKPVKVFDADIESELHEEFKEQRFNHPGMVDGRTEWFHYGGKFKEFLDNIEFEEIPYLTTYNIYNEMHLRDNIKYDRPQTESILERYDEYYKLKIGQKILILLGYIYYGPNGYATNHSGVVLNGYKILLTKDVLKEIVNKYKINILENRFDSAINNINKGKVYVRKMEDMWLIVSEI